ncbi:NUDIX domain-containing protein [Microbacterium sp. P07]|uniref:NUDIX domain-containing protein n=1 Tax=Microbacterium sp. P07 TaxID=3366952 RepID=UPI003745AEF5
MSIVPPAPGEPRRPHGPRDPGDAWVETPTGERYWGRFGAAGLLAIDPDRGVLLQHRVSWSHHGDTWALPGGARHQGESAHDAALRESAEEAGVPAGVIAPRFVSVLDLEVWSYTTLVGDVVVPFEPVISDPESRALAWVPVAEVDRLPLHPSFAESWTMLRPLLETRPVVVVDVANVMGSVPDGWWRDRAGAADRLLERIGTLAASGVPASALSLGGTRWFTPFVAVVEGQAKAVDADPEGVVIVRAAASGDDEIVAQTGALADPTAAVVVTSDRGLAERVRALGATVHGAGWLLDLLA